jgi:hypothetical protein
LDPIDPAHYPDADPKALKKITAEKMGDALISHQATWINPASLKPKNDGGNLVR